MIDTVQIEGTDIKRYREENNLTQSQLAKMLGVHRNTVSNYEDGKQIPDSKRELIASLMSNSTVNKTDAVQHQIKYPEDVSFIDLPFVSVPARASFIDMPDGVKGTTHETYTVIRKKNTNYEGQILIEVNGDSMEPNYPSGTIVRCKQVDPSDWAYIQSGVYAIVFANSFVIKRIKDNNYHEGYLTLHSDNTETGGKLNIKAEDLRQIWKVLRIVDAPAR